MAKSFWVGAGTGMLASAAVAAALRGRLLQGDPSDPRTEPGKDASREQLVEQLAERLQELEAAKRDLAEARADTARERAGTRMLADPVAQPAPSAPDIVIGLEGSGTLGEVPGLSELLDRADFKAAVTALSEAFEQGTLTKLDLMQLAVQYPELIVEGVNDYGLPDAFRSVLIDSLSSLADPLATVSALDLDQEPNQRFSSRIAAFLAQTVERSAVLDARTVPLIAKLLTGNEMVGEKVNLYPVLAQLGAMGDEEALALLRDVDVGFYEPGIRSLLNPPARDERGDTMTGAIIYSVQYNKGQWENRPRQLQGGDIVVSIGEERVTCASDFFGLLKKFHELGRYDFVEAGVFRELPPNSGQFEYMSLQLDPGDLRLLYGVYSVKRR